MFDGYRLLQEVISKYSYDITKYVFIVKATVLNFCSDMIKRLKNIFNGPHPNYPHSQYQFPEAPKDNYFLPF